jgi:chemotaxis protein methyltransferase WspC
VNLPAEIVSKLRQTVGLDPAIIGAGAIHRSLRDRMTALGLSGLEEYAELLRWSGPELQELVESVIVPETWFYRDEAPFRFLARQAATEWLSPGREKIIRILSIPCSTGEEPFSIAMTLLDSGMTREQFHIDAVDISERSLVRGKLGLYSKNSFRGEDPGYRERYFEQEGDWFRLCPEVSGTVRFQQGNLLDPRSFVTTEPYDVIFCRNLMIYLSPEARIRAIQILDCLLAHPGLLFVGHAETLQVKAPRLVGVEYKQAFAFRTEVSRCAGPRPDCGVSNPVTVATPGETRLQSGRPLNSQPIPRLIKENDPGPVAAVVAGVPGPQTDREERKELLADAQQEADAGNLNAAAELCERCLAHEGPSAQAYFILGLVKEAAGKDSEAELYFNRAIYLQPSYYEALIHLSLLIRQKDAPAAALLEHRARRVRLLDAS